MSPTTHNANNKNSRRIKKRKLNMRFIVPSVLVVFLILFIPISISNGGYKGLMKDYCKSINKQNYQLYKNSFPSFITENGLEDLMLFAYDSGENYIQSIYNDYTQQYGEKFKLSCKVIDRTKLSKDKLAQYSADSTSLCTDGSEIKIKKGYKLTISMKYKGKIDTNTQELSVIVIKYDGHWYIYDDSNNSDIHFC